MSETKNPKRDFPSIPELCAAADLGLGWGRIAVEARGKRPLVKWELYQHRRPTTAEVHGWFTRWPDANVGIVTGALSGLVVIDLDGEEAIREFCCRIPAGEKLSTP